MNLRISSGDVEPRAAWDSVSEDEDDHGYVGSGGDSTAQLQVGVHASEEDSYDPEDWWYRYMMKHGTDKISKRN